MHAATLTLELPATLVWEIYEETGLCWAPCVCLEQHMLANPGQQGVLTGALHCMN